MSSPTRIVLSSMREHGVRYLLMGGQACIVYGAAEFSRDTDIAILAEPDNLRRLQTALTALEARVIAIPPFEPRYLARGHFGQHPGDFGRRCLGARDTIDQKRGRAELAEPEAESLRSLLEVRIQVVPLHEPPNHGPILVALSFLGLNEIGQGEDVASRAFGQPEDRPTFP